MYGQASLSLVGQSQRDGILGVQQLVSTYSNCNPVLGSQNSKCQDLPKFQLFLFCFVLFFLGGEEGIL